MPAGSSRNVPTTAPAKGTDERLREEQTTGDERLREEQTTGDERLRQEQTTADERLREEQTIDERLREEETIMTQPARKKSGLGRGLASLIPTGPTEHSRGDMAPRLGDAAADLLMGGAPTQTAVVEV